MTRVVIRFECPHCGNRRVTMIALDNGACPGCLAPLTFDQLRVIREIRP